MQTAGAIDLPRLDTRTGVHRGITATHGWMPKSGYGPYCTISEAVLDGSALKGCGIPSFADARCEIESLAEIYAERATVLVGKAREQRLQLSQNIRGLDGEQLVRPHRLRLCVSVRENYLYLGWRGVVKVRGKWVRYEAPTWDCQSRLDSLIADTHPAEEQFVRQIEEEASEIRRRWFALVRMAHYMNVVSDHRHRDVVAAETTSERSGLLSSVLRRMRRLVGA